MHQGLDQPLGKEKHPTKTRHEHAPERPVVNVGAFIQDTVETAHGRSINCMAQRNDIAVGSTVVP